MIEPTLINDFINKQVLVIGDVMLDRYTHGEVSRLSPEAPVPILKKSHDKFTLGGAANVASNAKALGANVILCGCIGDDGNGKKIIELVNLNGIDSSLLITQKNTITTTKHRIVSSKQQMLRIDEEEEMILSNKNEEKIIKLLKQKLKNIDVVILSDYAKGFFSEKIANYIIGTANKLNKIVIVDCKPKNKAYFKHSTLVKPNLIEAKEMSGETEINKMGEKLVSYFHSSIAITCGNDGIYYFGKNKDHLHVEGRKIDVFDVSGAGDTVTAVIGLALCSNLTIKDSLYLANYAAGLVVQKSGTETISSEELQSISQEELHLDKVSIVPKLWGYEKWIENNKKYCSKLLFVKKGYQCSLHYHKIKDEMFIVTSGHIRLEVNDKVIHLHPGNFYRIPPNTKHRFRGIEESIMIEVSTQHMDEDSYRVEESRKVE